MESISFGTTLLFLVNLTALAVFVYLSFDIHRAKPGDLPWRGFVKIASLAGVPAALETTYRRWLVALVAFFALTCLSVAVVVWATDHSFFVVLFPLLFYYFFARYLLWEKQDLTD